MNTIKPKFIQNRKINFSLILYILAIYYIFASCSTHKDKLINRLYHNITTVNNVLFNGNNSLDKVEEDLVDGYEEDFNKMLPMFPYERSIRSSDTKNNLKRAVEKATKSIQKHSMNIKGVEKNTYIDDAYLLLGKARFYQNKFLPALESFNYIRLNFKGKNTSTDASLWAIRTLIELENYTFAISETVDVLKNKKLSKKTKIKFYILYADALVKQGSYKNAITKMEEAIKLENKKRKKTRYTYILAQIYNLDGDKQMSSKIFDEVIALGKPYKYVLYAKLNKAENFDGNKNNMVPYILELNEILHDKKNIDDINKIYYEIGNIYYKVKDYENAEINLRKSIDEAKNKKYERGISFELLGHVYIEQAQYKKSSIAYDSMLVAMPKTYKNYKTIYRKRKQLNDVIKFLDIITRTDSILKVVSMSDSERKLFYQNHINRLKEQEKLEKKRAIEQARMAQINRLKSISSGIKSKGFYLYNSITMISGKIEFKKRWGDRPLQDKWRITSSSINPLENRGVDGDKSINTTSSKSEKNPLYKVDYYLKKIPTNKDTLELMESDRNFAYYALGLIYNEQFEKYELSNETLIKLLSYKPVDEVKLPTYYYLYKNYKLLKNKSEEDKYKNIILEEFPNSRYAGIIRNPEKINTVDKQKIDLQFDDLVDAMHNREFRKTIAMADNIIKNNFGASVIPKVELIKALSIGKLGSIGEYESALNYVRYSFPNDNISDEAKKNLRKLKKEKKEKFDFKNTASPRIVIFANKFTDLSKIEKEVDYVVWQKKLKTKESEFSFSKNVFVVYNFSDMASAKKFQKEFLTKNKVSTVLKDENIEIIIISKHNFNIMQRKKNIDLYTKGKE